MLRNLPCQVRPHAAGLSGPGGPSPAPLLHPLCSAGQPAPEGGLFPRWPSLWGRPRMLRIGTVLRGNCQSPLSPGVSCRVHPPAGGIWGPRHGLPLLGPATGSPCLSLLWSPCQARASLAPSSAFPVLLWGTVGKLTITSPKGLPKWSHRAWGRPFRVLPAHEASSRLPGTAGQPKKGLGGHPRLRRPPSSVHTHGVLAFLRRRGPEPLESPGPCWHRSRLATWSATSRPSPGTGPRPHQAALTISSPLSNPPSLPSPHATEGREP